MSVGIYWKQLIAFVALALVAGGGIWYTRSQVSEASTVQREPLATSSVVTIDVTLNDGGTATVNGKTFGGLVRFEPDGIRFDYQAYQQDGAFITQLTTNVHLPRAVAADALVARHAASYGVQAPEPTVLSPTLVTYTAYNLTPKAEYRLELVLPRGSITPTLYLRLADGLRTLPAATWLAVAVALPLLATLILLGMFALARRSWAGTTSTAERATLPDDGVAPALAGVLVEGKVSPRSLAATLLHLAERGYLQVSSRADGFSFGRKRQLDLPAGTAAAALAPFETTLLDKLLNADSIRTTAEDVQLRIGRHVFSRKIAEVYLGMYQAAVTKGWFAENPQAGYRRFRLLSYAVIGAALTGFVAGLLVGPDPYFYLLGWVGLFFVGIVMQRIIPFLPRRTAAGQRAYQDWIAFKNFLKKRQPLDPAALSGVNAQGLYERYLPYAIVFGVEVEWTERFLGLPFTAPDWYVSTADIHVIDQFANSLFPFIGTVAYDLARAREPNAI